MHYIECLRTRKTNCSDAGEYLMLTTNCYVNGGLV
jgi:hypothetical protein